MDPMSIAAVGWLMSALVSRAVTELLEAWSKRIGLGNEFKTLKEQLLQLGALLTSARALRTSNSFLEELVQNLQQLAYWAENLLDELDYYRLQDEVQKRGTQEKVNRNQNSSVASSSSSFRLASNYILSPLKGMSCRSAQDVLVSVPKTIFSRINLSRRINELAKQLQQYEKKVRNAVETESLITIATNTGISQTEAIKLRQKSSYLTETRVFGRDQERDQLMDLLTNEKTAIVGKVPVLAIVGSGGVGKTTLAQLVFNDPKVHSYFEVRLWICVSTQFDIDRLTHEMLEGACGTRCNLTNLKELQNKLENELKSKRFLIVLDDIWEDKDKSQWDSIMAPLNCCRVKGGIILVTTRNQAVAKMMNARVISLHGIKKDAFLSFFNTCIFDDPNYSGNLRLGNIGQEIANKLKGNPLAAKTVSALLKENLDEIYWMEIRDSDEWKSQNGPTDIMPALQLSYEHMPFHLQRCFSYCAMFPEDHPFTLKDLVYEWMAQGFLDVRSEGKMMEDIGSAYFNDLFSRGYFQTKQSTYGGLVRYTFHDLIHDLARMVSFKECLSINDTEPKQIPTTIRHLSIFRSTKRGEETIIRALAFFEGGNLSTIINWDDKLPSGTFQSISGLLKKSKFLRAMRLNICFVAHQHNFIQNFVSLRYLRLSLRFSPSQYASIGDKNNLAISHTFPREICRLYHLEVFEIEDGEFAELPKKFIDLVSLRHFIVEGDLHSKIWGVGNLTSLQELNYFNVQQKIGFEIEQLGSLKEIGGSLHIWNIQNIKSKTEASKAELEEKKKLDALYLQWNHGKQENESVMEGLKPTTNLKSLRIVGYGGVASPTWLQSSLNFLEFLTLENCKAWQQLPPIGELERLKHLKLSGLAVREIGRQCYGTHQSMKFPSLEKLDIIDMPDLEKWVWSDHLEQFLCLSKLTKLTIEGCPKLVDLPLLGCDTFEVLKRFPSIDCLKIEDCPLILQLPPLPYSSVLSFISIARVKTTKSRLYVRQMQNYNLIMDQSSSLLDERLYFHEVNSLRALELSNISSESLDLHSCAALENLVIKGCQSLTSLTFGEHSVCLKYLKIISCKTLSSIKGLKFWVNLKRLHFRECPSFVAAWDSELKEIERIEPNFSLSLQEIDGDSLDLLYLPICKQLTSLETFHLDDIKGCKNLQSFPFDLLPSLKRLWIRFPNNYISQKNSQSIIDECLKIRNIKEINIKSSEKVELVLRGK